MSIESAQELLQRKREVAARVRERMSDDLFGFGDNERLEPGFELEMNLDFLGEAGRAGGARGWVVRGLRRGRAAPVPAGDGPNCESMPAPPCGLRVGWAGRETRDTMLRLARDRARIR